MEAPGLEWTARLTVLLGAPLEIGPTARGLHRVIPITGGSVEGPRFSGRILPGGADWQYVASDGLTEVDARYTMESSSGVRVGISSRGVRFGPPDVLARLGRGEAVGPGEYYFRTAMRFEAPRGEFEWMGQAIFLAKAQRLPSEVRIDVFQVL